MLQEEQGKGSEHSHEYCSTSDAYRYGNVGEEGSSGHTIPSGASGASGKQLLQSLMENHRNDSGGALSDAIMVSSEMGIVSEWEDSEGNASSQVMKANKSPSLFQWKVHEKLFLPISMFRNCTNDLKREASSGSIDLSEWEIVTVGNDTSNKDIALLA